MFGLGFGEILVLAAIGLIVLGPKQMPQVARVLGRTIGELRKALRDVSTSLAVDLDEKKPPASTAFAPAPHEPPAPIGPNVVLHSVTAPDPTQASPTEKKKEES